MSKDADKMRQSARGEAVLLRRSATMMKEQIDQFQVEMRTAEKKCEKEIAKRKKMQALPGAGRKKIKKIIQY